MVPSFSDVVFGWVLDPATVVLVGVSGGLYAIGVRRLARRGRRWSTGRTAAFSAGLAILVVATCSGLGRYEGARFVLHSVQHVLLGMAAPLLLALGGPVTLALQASSRPWQLGLLRLLHARPVAVLTHPVVAWVAFGGTLIALYSTPLLEASVEHDALHAGVHVHMVAVGCLFAWVAVGVDPLHWRLPHGARLLFVALAVPFHAVLGLALVGSTGLVAPAAYPELADQQAAGGVLWATGDLFGLVAAGIVLAQWMGHEERAAVRADRQTEPEAQPV